MQNVIAAMRILVGLVLMALAVAIQIAVLLVLMPSRNARIRSCNYWGKVTGRLMMTLSGCPMTYEDLDRLDRTAPAIYACNHTSNHDAFMAMYLAPVGTCGVVKKQIIYYPFFGQMYLLSGHLRIDRSNREAAIASMGQLSDDVKRYGLGIYMWPEGTRSRDGRLLGFKKGLVHMALSTGLPIVPIVTSGAQHSWVKGQLLPHPAPIHVKVLPQIDTSAWSKETLGDHLYEVWDTMRQHLPEDQQPSEETVAKMEAMRTSTVA